MDSGRWNLHIKKFVPGGAFRETPCCMRPLLLPAGTLSPQWIIELSEKRPMSSPSYPSSVPGGQRSRLHVQLVTDVYIGEIHEGVVDYSRLAGWDLFDGKCFFPASTRQEAWDGVLGIISTPGTKEWLKSIDCPVVHIMENPGNPAVPAVDADWVAIGTRGAEHLLSLGSLTCVFYRLGESRETHEMWSGFSGVLAAAGHTAQLLTAGTHSEEKPRVARWSWLCEQLSKLPRPLAIMVEDDRFVSDVFEAAAMLGWEIPQDLAVLGTDNRALVLGKLPIPVSSVDTNLREIGRSAAEYLDHLMKGGTATEEPRVIAPFGVVARESTATFVSNHPGLDKVVNYLRKHFAQPPNLPGLARSAGLSVRSLQTAFKAEMGHPLSEEISQLRLKEAARLLRDTDLKLESVALESGFGTASYLCRVFRSHLGETPTRYREIHGRCGHS